ncbi:MAG TPA: radical SAM protein, partial [Lachnospiraceae bacterium]|nr:radical SAM protein [Lachnospiraceae bacterium]
MGDIGHKVKRAAFEGVLEKVLKDVKKDREATLLKLIDMTEDLMKDHIDTAIYPNARKLVKDPDSKWMKYFDTLVDEIDPYVLKMTLMNLGFESMLAGTKQMHKMREKYNCNIPWVILMDPTSACNLHCTGCWAAEYGHTLSLSYEELDRIVTQGKELGVHFYMYTGGEPLVRRADIMKICKKHNDCMFLAYTNGTLVDEEYCKEMQQAGNLALAISLEGYEEVNDGRRGAGVFDKVMHAMDLLKQYGLVFGTSICYTRNNIETVTSDEFLDMIIAKG